MCDGAILAMTCLTWPDLRAGQRILIYGASGSIGTAAVQLAKHIGAHVTAVCNTANVEVVRSLGADEVIDYTVEDFAANGQTYDVVFDAVGKKSFAACKGSLKRRRELRLDRPRPVLAERAAHAVDEVRRVEEGDDADPPLHQGQGPPHQGAHRGRRVPGRHRPHLPAGARPPTRPATSRPSRRPATSSSSSGRKPDGLCYLPWKNRYTVGSKAAAASSSSADGLPNASISSPPSSAILPMRSPMFAMWARTASEFA